MKTSSEKFALNNKKILILQRVHILITEVISYLKSMYYIVNISLTTTSQ